MVINDIICNINLIFYKMRQKKSPDKEEFSIRFSIGITLDAFGTIR
jgi:hypothetical protein